MFEQFEKIEDFWELFLAAGKEWFPNKAKTREGKAFSTRFEIEEATWWNGDHRFQPIFEDYMTWRYDK